VPAECDDDATGDNSAAGAKYRRCHEIGNHVGNETTDVMARDFRQCGRFAHVADQRMEPDDSVSMDSCQRLNGRAYRVD
jgi:hypothetical protein